MSPLREVNPEIDVEAQTVNENHRRRTRNSGEAEQVDGSILENKRKRKQSTAITAELVRKSRKVGARTNGGKSLRLRDAVLFETQQTLGYYTNEGLDSGLGYVPTFELEFSMWKGCREIIMQIVNMKNTNMYVDARMCGNGFVRINTAAKVTGGQPNPDFVNQSKHQKTSDAMRRVISRTRHETLMAFLIVSEKIGHKDCFHRGIDWLAQLADGRAHLERDSLCFRYDLTSGNGKRQEVRRNI